MSSSSDAQLDRLSKALRENLRKRKIQMRERLQSQKKASEEEKSTLEVETLESPAPSSLQKKDSD